MKTEYVWIIIIYILSGCTPLPQACNVSIWKILKLAMKRSAHADVADEILQKLKQEMLPGAVQLEKKVGMLRDRSVR